MLLSSLSPAYQTRALLLGLSPTMAVVCFRFSSARLVSISLILAPLVCCVVLDLIESQRLKRDLTSVPYRVAPGLSAKSGRDKLKKLLPKRTGQRYLIVGTGGVGRRLITLLQERGETDVYGFDLCSHSKVADFLDQDFFIQGNVTSLLSCQKAIDKVKPDVVFHTAAVITFAQRKPSQWSFTYDVNVKGVLNMLQASNSIDHQAKSFILTSSAVAGLSRNDLKKSVTGNEVRFPPQTSKDNALSWYTCSKALAETEALQYCANRQLDAPALGIIRPASAIFHHLDKMEMAFKDMNASTIGFERSVSDWVYVDNVALGHLLLEKQLNAGKCRGETFLISNQEPLMALELYRRLQTAFVPGFILWKVSSTLVFLLATFTEIMTTLGFSVPHKVGLLSYATLHLATISYTMDDSKAQEMLGYQPAFTIDEAILQVMEDHQKHFPEGALAKSMTNKKHS